MESTSWISFDHAAMRFLSTADNDDDTTNGGGSASRAYDDSQVLKGTFLVYGSILLVIIVLFCWVRRRFPRVYRLRSWVKDTTGDHSTFVIPNEGQGLLSWIGKVYEFRDDEILRKCGMDALCFIRIANFGFRCKCRWRIVAGAETPLFRRASHFLIESTVRYVRPVKKVSLMIAWFLMFEYKSPA